MLIKLMTDIFEWATYRVTVQEVAQLSDREMAILGIDPSEVYDSASQSVLP